MGISIYEKLSIIIIYKTSSLLPRIESLRWWKALKQTIPDASWLLCRWHISKDIFCQAEKRLLTLDAWEDFVQACNWIVDATTLVLYKSKLASMHVVFRDVSMSYLDCTWLVYEEFFSVFLRNKCHYGDVTTSRVESNDTALKNRYLCQPVRW